MTDVSPTLVHHFEDRRQQREAADFGMWLFLATEVMFFGGLILAYIVYRLWYFDEFVAAGRTLDAVLGAINTAVLLTSSLTMALAVRAAEADRRRLLLMFLLATTLLGATFLAIKGYEYYHKWKEHHIPFAGLPFDWPDGGGRVGAGMFFNLYFVMTGVHAFHMILGIGLLLSLIALALRPTPVAKSAVLIGNAGLYWHFVDLVWVYLFPLLYLIARRGGSA